ncbi:hypothetical protein, partial [Clostridioides difficile]|uniref:hypothetical protein n=1 Tax=Clostridioides difficile TaxID=1496 RepID=UPI0018DDFE1C
LADGRFFADIVMRPFPLLLTVTRGDIVVVLAPGPVWDRGRDLLKPFGERFAEGVASLVLLGRPDE